MGLMNKLRGFRSILAFENRWSLILTKVLFPSESLLVYRYRGLDILIDRTGGDANGAREVLTSPMYRRFLPSIKLEHPANVLDLGASNGGFPLLLLASGIKLDKIVSVEFNPNTYIRLHFNLLRNFDCDAIAVNAALSGENAVLKLRPGPGGASDNIYDTNEGSDRPERSIRGLTFDELYQTYFTGEIIDICKMDVEGAEFDVFLNPMHQSLRNCRYLIIEIHEQNGRKADEIIPIIQGLGFDQTMPPSKEDPGVYFFANSKLGSS
jgi:FkbM family methyltransferase